ncbi:malonate decarboxylase holo-ACP synthase [Acinetobacter stercoris]|nr:malonate decarboxylase holo-ACP synthase [Acinetobacter stercoris]
MVMNTCYQAHDLLWGMTDDWLESAAPDWIKDVLSQNQPVVVRRAQPPPDMVAVGVRGKHRHQRYATQMPKSMVSRQLKPENLIHLDAAKYPHIEEQFLHVHRVLIDYIWGYTGSFAYELATGMNVLTENSDIDLIIRVDTYLEKDLAKFLFDQLRVSGLKLDIQLQTPQGGVALKEWMQTTDQVLLKRNDTALLVVNPWA